jgi:hypothetical protein
MTRRCSLAMIAALALQSSVVGAATKPKPPAAPKVMAIELMFTPQENTGSDRPILTAGITERPIRIVLNDAREPADVTVGAQLNDGVQQFTWQVAEMPAAKISGFTEQTLHGWFIQLAPDAPLELVLGLSRYYVTESKQAVGSSYTAEVGFRASLVGGDGASLWSGTAFGEAHRFGRAESSANCNEVLSDALKAALSNLFSQAGLQSRWAPITAADGMVASTIAPAKLLDDLLKLKAGGMTDETLAAYAKTQRVSPPLTADDLLEWKAKGIPETAIQAALVGH